MFRIFRNIFFKLFCFILTISTIQAAEPNASISITRPALPHYQWNFEKLLGSYDNASVQRGYLVYRQACASCHSINAMRYADLQQAGLTLEQIDKIAQQDRIMDGKDTQGQDHYRPATVTDYFIKPYVNDEMAKAVNNGRIPVDFSRYMMIRNNAANYVMAILSGYRSAPENFQFDQKGSFYNIYALHQQIGMKPPLTNNGVHFEDGTPATVEQQARDVVTFLSWTAHPHLTERHRVGIMLFLYMIFIIILVFLVNCKVWLNVKK